MSERVDGKGGLPRPTEEYGAYLSWCQMDDRYRRGWLQRLSQQTGIPVHRLKDWRTRYQWNKRLADDLIGAKNAIYREGEGVLLHILQPGMERLGEIILHGSDKDAINGLKLLAEMMGMTDSAAKVQVNVGLPDQATLAKFKEASVDEYRKLLAEAGQANIDVARQSRFDRKLPVKSGL